MEDKRITADEIESLLAGEIHTLAGEMAAAMNDAKAGRIIADSEELVRDASREVQATGLREGHQPPAGQAGGFFPLGPKDSATRGPSR